MAKNLEISFLLDFYGEMLTKKQHDFLIYYYDEDLSLSEIAENEGITRQGVRDAIKRAENQLFDMEKDPFEMDNLAQKPEYAEILLKLKNQFADWMEKNRDPIRAGFCKLNRIKEWALM